jgi:hypothetical protein
MSRWHHLVCACPRENCRTWPNRRWQLGALDRSLAAPRDQPAADRSWPRLGPLCAGRGDDVEPGRLFGRRSGAPIFDDPVRPANPARFVFLDPRATDFYVDWERTANDIVAILRAEAGRNPYDRGLTDLVGELSTRSEAFRTRWATHVRFHRTGFKQLHHPIVGDLDLTYEAFELPSDPGLTLLAYTAEPGSPTHDALNLLASWAATLDQHDQADRADRADQA